MPGGGGGAGGGARGACKPLASMAVFVKLRFALSLLLGLVLVKGVLLQSKSDGVKCRSAISGLPHFTYHYKCAHMECMLAPIVLPASISRTYIQCYHFIFYYRYSAMFASLLREWRRVRGNMSGYALRECHYRTMRTP